MLVELPARGVETLHHMEQPPTDKMGGINLKIGQGVFNTNGLSKGVRYRGVGNLDSVLEFPWKVAVSSAFGALLFDNLSTASSRRFLPFPNRQLHAFRKSLSYCPQDSELDDYQQHRSVQRCFPFRHWLELL